MKWSERRLVVGMPHMVPGQLSEVELLKALGDAQWTQIANILGTPSASIRNDTGERLYASFINIDLSFGGATPMDFGEGTELHIRHAARLFAQRFVEGFFCFDGQPVDEGVIRGVDSRDALQRLTLPTLYLTNAFVTREESNSRLRTFAPAGAAPSAESSTDVVPPGIQEHEMVERTGVLGLDGFDDATPVASDEARTILCPIVPENDLNGAGLLYFARYIAIANYGERVFLTTLPEVDVSTRLAGLLSTRRRKIVYFANADAGDSVRMRTRARVAVPRDLAAGSTDAIPLTFYFTTEMRRHSDGVLMAKSAAEKVLRVSKGAKSQLLEAFRLRRHFKL